MRSPGRSVHGRSPGRSAAAARLPSPRTTGYRGGDQSHKSWRSASPMHRGGTTRGEGRSMRRSPGRMRGKDDRSSPGPKKPYRNPVRERGIQRRFSPVRNRRRSLSRERSASPRNERRRLSSGRNEDRGRPHDRSRKSFERRLSPMEAQRSSLSPPKRQRSSSPAHNWDSRNQMSGVGDRSGGGRAGGGDNGSHHDEMYKDMMSSRSMECRNDLGMGSRTRAFSPGRSQQPSDIDERMQGRSNSPYRSDRFMENENRQDMNRNYQGDNQQMMTNDIMPNNQGFQGINFTGGGNRPAQDEFLGRDSLNSGFNIVVTENPKPYTHEELKKITVDIFRNVPAEASNMNKRHVLNPEDVIIVRRSGEGMRPIFDRDEIRQAQQAKDVTFERRVVAIVNDRSDSPHMNTPAEFSGPGERENFQISSEHFNAYSNPNSSTRQSLNDRWQRLQIESMNAERSGGMMMKNPRQLSPCRDIPYDHHQQQPHDNRGGDVVERHRSRSRSQSPISRRSDTRFGGRRSSQYNDDRRNRRYSTLYERRERFPSESSASNRQFDQLDLSRRKGHVMERHDQRPFHGRGGMTNHHGGAAGRFRQRPDRGYDTRPPPEGPNEIRDLEKEKSWERGADGEKLPNFSTRPDKYHYQEWLEKPDVVPKGPSYFEHDNRGERRDRDARGRGTGRGRSSRGGTFRGRGFVPRGRGGQNTFVTKSKWSPNHWQHDMFERSPDQNSVQDNNPSSTTGSK